MLKEAVELPTFRFPEVLSWALEYRSQLFSLTGDTSGAAVSVAIIGLLFVVASLLSLIRVRRLQWHDLADLVFIVGLTVVFVLQLIAGLELNAGPRSGAGGAAHTIAILVTVCFLVGIARAWELVGGPSIGIAHEAGLLMPKRQPQD